MADASYQYLVQTEKEGTPKAPRSNASIFIEYVYKMLRPFEIRVNPQTGERLEQEKVDDLSEYDDLAALGATTFAFPIGLATGRYANVDDTVSNYMATFRVYLDNLHPMDQKSYMERYLLQKEHQETWTPQEFKINYCGKELKYNYIPALGNAPNINIGIGYGEGFPIEESDYNELPKPEKFPPMEEPSKEIGCEIFEEETPEEELPPE